MTSIQIVSLIAVVVYIVIILALARALAKKSIMAGASGGRLPWFIIAATTMATVMNAAQLLGTAGGAYLTGFAQMTWSGIISMLCCLILVPLVGERLSSVKCATLNDVVIKRFPKNKATGVILNAWFFIWGIFACSLSIFGGAVVLQTLLGLNFWVAAIATCVVALIYNMLGGLEAMSVVDTIQYVFIGVLVAIMCPILFAKFGTFSVFFREVLGTTGYDLTAAGEAIGIAPGFVDLMHLPGWGAAGLAAYICACALWCCCDMGIMQRMLNERKPGDGIKGVATYVIIFLPTLFIITVYGLYARVMYPGLTYTDSAVLLIGQSVLGDAGTVLLMVATVAAILSTVGAYLNALGLTVRGIYERTKPEAPVKTLKLVEYGGVALIAALSLLASSLFGTDGIVITCVAVQMCMVATLVPMMLLMVSWKRFSGKAAFWGCLMGLVVSVASTFYAGGAYAAIMGGGFFGIPTLFLGWLVAIPIYVIGSFIDKAGPEDMSPEFRKVFEEKHPYIGRKTAIVAIIILVVVVVTMVVGFSGALGIFPALGADFGVMDFIILLFAAVALFGCIFLTYKLVRYVYIDKDFYKKNGGVEEEAPAVE